MLDVPMVFVGEGVFSRHPQYLLGVGYLVFLLHVRSPLTTRAPAVSHATLKYQFHEFEI